MSYPFMGTSKNVVLSLAKRKTSVFGRIFKGSLDWFKP